MAERSITAHEYTCDGCGNTRIALGDDLPNGYHGERLIRVANDRETETSNWYACTSRCIGKAVNNATTMGGGVLVESNHTTEPLAIDFDDDPGVLAEPGDATPIPEPEGGLDDSGTPVRAANPAWS